MVAENRFHYTVRLQKVKKEKFRSKIFIKNNLLNPGLTTEVFSLLFFVLKA